VAKRKVLRHRKAKAAEPAATGRPDLIDASDPKTAVLLARIALIESLYALYEIPEGDWPGLIRAMAPEALAGRRKEAHGPGVGKWGREQNMALAGDVLLVKLGCPRQSVANACSKLATDPFWKTFLERDAWGKGAIRKTIPRRGEALRKQYYGMPADHKAEGIRALLDLIRAGRLEEWDSVLRRALPWAEMEARRVVK
jgi:hypothetical protein